MGTGNTPQQFDAKVQLIQDKDSADGRQLEHEPTPQPSSLQRSIPDLLLLVCADLLAILSWCAMLLYASLLWYSHGKREIVLSERMFSPRLLMDFTRPVRFKYLHGAHD